MKARVAIVYAALSFNATTAMAQPRSVVFDRDAADLARLRQRPAYIESIVVEGRDPYAAATRKKPLEQRFADALLAPPPSPTAGLRFLDTTPCMSMASTWNNIGNSYAPISGCPR